MEICDNLQQVVSCGHISTGKWTQDHHIPFTCMMHMILFQMVICSKLTFSSILQMPT